MSRIGMKPIAIPGGVKVSVENGSAVIAGKLGTLHVAIPEHISVEVADSNVIVKRDGDNAKALHGLVRSLINNAVSGVVSGYKKELAIVGVGYKAELKGKTLVLSIGYSHTIEYPVPEGIKLTVTDGVKITIEGFDKQLVGECAARIRRFKKPEPYKGKGIRYADEHVVIKPGKTNA
jgi:large subunit ribosomal protein L6